MCLQRRSSRPADLLMVVQALFVITTLVGVATANVNAINSDPKNLPTAVLVQDQGAYSRSILGALERSEYFAITHVARSPAEMDELIDSDHADDEIKEHVLDAFQALGDDGRAAPIAWNDERIDELIAWCRTRAKVT